MTFRLSASWMILLIFLFSSLPDVSICSAEDLENARELRLKGRYDEAEEVFESLIQQDSTNISAIIGLSRVEEERGEWKALTERLQRAVKRNAKSAELSARLAEVLFAQGRYSEAETALNQALKLKPDQPLARLVQANLFTEKGELKEALQGYVWFVRYYNRAQPEDAETLMYVAEGAAQYARWKRSTQIFSFIVNTLCPDALKDEKLHWPAYYVSGELLLEKYNRSQGLPELREALAINPSSAKIIAMLGRAAYDKRELEETEKLADRALKINPTLIQALWLKADLMIDAGNLAEARRILLRAKEVNPRHQQTLGRLAACEMLLEGAPSEKELEDLLSRLETLPKANDLPKTKFVEIVKEVASINSAPGKFLFKMGETVERRRKFHLAEILYREATKRMPQLADPKTELGMLYLRMGKHDLARDLLDAAFKADPYHVRVNNMRKVLKVLDGYDTIQTDHFVIHFDSQLDRVLAEYMAEYLEEIYPELTKTFQFEPLERTHFEIYNKAKGASGHEWFSTRMIGLPWIQTIGASTGMIVALTSPAAAQEPFNWARVLKHEFVHVITLQQTKFNIPHWYTEALAVTHEGYPGPDMWNELLLERVPKGNLRRLTNLSEGFTRAKNGADWQFAYCQSQLYAEYMIKKFGPETIPALLEAYKNNLTTEQAIPKVFKVDMETFEKGYRDYLEKIVKKLQSADVPLSASFEELKKTYEADSDKTDNAAEYAYALLKRRKIEEAKSIAEEVLKQDSKQPWAGMVLGFLHFLNDEHEEAIQVLSQVLDKKKPHPKVMKLLANLYMNEEEFEKAEELFLLGRKQFSKDRTWLKGLISLYTKQDQKEKLIPVLEEFSQWDPDDAGVRQKLAELYFEKNDYEKTIQSAKLALHVDVLDARTHELLGTAHQHQKDYKKAVREYEVVLQLKPDETEVSYRLAECYQKLGQKERAKDELKKILNRNPDHDQAKQFLEKLQ